MIIAKNLFIPLDKILILSTVRAGNQTICNLSNLNEGVIWPKQLKTKTVSLHRKFSIHEEFMVCVKTFEYKQWNHLFSTV